MSGIDDLNFEDLVEGVINTIDEAKTEKISAQKLFAPKARKGVQTPILSGKEMAAAVPGGGGTPEPLLEETVRMPAPAKGPPAAPTTPATAVPAAQARPPETPGDGGPKASFDHIYQRGAVPPTPFTVFRLEELMNDAELASLDPGARVVAVKAILRSHDAEIEHVVADAVARTAALDAHDDKIRGQIERVEREIEVENAHLQQEIEDFANPRIAKMEKNNARIERLRGEYTGWTSRRAAEADRIAAILEPWGSDDRLRSTHRVLAPEPVTAPSLATADEPLDEHVEAPREIEQDALAAAQADHWSFDDEPTIEPAIHATVAPADTTFDADAVAATGELEFTPSRVRIPESPLQGLVAGFAVLIWAAAGLLLAAQLTMIVAPAAAGVAWGAPVVLAFLIAFGTRRSNNYWTGFFSMLFVWGLTAFVVAHAMGPAALVRNLTERPVWFVDELGLSSEIETGVGNATTAYAEAVGPLLGVASARPNP